MHVTEWRPGDMTELTRMAGVERDAVQRDKYRAVVQAMGGREASDIAHALGRSRLGPCGGGSTPTGTTGSDALMPGTSAGRPTKLPRDHEGLFLARFAGGPTDTPTAGSARCGVCTLRGLDAVRIPATEFQASYTLDGAYALLHRLGYSCPTPRPRHEKNDPAAARAFEGRAPFLSGL